MGYQKAVESAQARLNNTREYIAEHERHLKRMEDLNKSIDKRMRTSEFLGLVALPAFAITTILKMIWAK